MTKLYVKKNKLICILHVIRTTIFFVHTSVNTHVKKKIIIRV